MECYLSLDVGTTAVKAALFAVESGALVALSLKEYALETPAKDFVELDPEVYWRCCVETAREAISRAGIDGRAVRSIGVSSQGETIILLDEDARPVRNAIVWLDTRATEEAAELAGIFGNENPTGQIELSATWPVSKVRWLNRHEPQTVARTSRLLLVEDFILHRLTGEFCGEYSLYTSSYMLDIRHKRWWRGMLDAAGIPVEWLSPLSESGRVVGRVRADAREAIGLGPDCVAVTGAMDQTAAMLGAGSIGPGIATETTGAALVVAGTLGGYPAGRIATMALQCHAVPGEYLVMGWTSAGGISFKWLRDTLFPDVRDQARRLDQDPYDSLIRLAAEIATGSDGLLFLPFMAGPGTLRLDPALRGLFSGLTLSHTRGHLVRALLEGLSLVMRMVLSDMEELGTDYEEVRSLGGGARSDLWCQIKADVIGRPIRRMKCPEASALGTAMLQAVATGRYASLAEAAGNMVETSMLFEPDPRTSAAALELRSRFADLVRQVGGR